MAMTDDGLVVFLASGGGCSLDSSPGKNWVENSGGLPDYICKIAKGIMKSGKSKSSAIAIAVSRVKKWAAGGDDVDADTVAKAAKAAAQWEALKTKNKSKNVVKASREDGSEYVMLTSEISFNTDIVRQAWGTIQKQIREMHHGATADGVPETSPSMGYSYVRELWSDHIIVEQDGYPGPQPMVKIPYIVENGVNVRFGRPVQVKQEYVEVEPELTDVERALLADVLVLSKEQTALDRLVAAIRPE